jgi:hypothetical protein
MNATERKPCRHCGQRLGSRARGLCYRCNKIPEVREQYPPIHPNARRGLGINLGSAPSPLDPTRALPGSAAKLHILEARAEAGLTLWHPDDPVIGQVIPWTAPRVHCMIRLDDE